MNLDINPFANREKKLSTSRLMSLDDNEVNNIEEDNDEFLEDSQFEDSNEDLFLKS